jgi:membrane-bound metal-dependent hydrolase YbcI (DUF457 family)
MLTSLHSHSSLGAICTAIVIFIWNQKNPDQRVSIIVMAFFGFIVARIPDWDIFLNEELGWDSTNMAHRSVYTHSVLGIMLFGLTFLIIIYAINMIIKKYDLGNVLPNKIISFALTVSVISHVFSDALEDYPTRTFYPLTKNEFYGFIPTSFYHNEIFLISLIVVSLVGILALDNIDKKNAKKRFEMNQSSSEE